jgi:hypothetical protein
MDRKLPIGIQSFEKLRDDGFVYVDKTAYVWRLAHAGIPVFLSRPRRFGKSLLASTLRAYFEGRRDLFEGLEIERLEGSGPNAWVKRPVFYLDFNGADYTQKGGLEDMLDTLLRGLEERWGDDRSGFAPGPRFRRVIELAHEMSGHRVTVIVDEYDKPLLDTMENEPLLERNRFVLKAFFSVLKAADEHLRFVFITGVTKFSKVSLFSDLNQLRDISLERDYATICGITETELLDGFGPELETLASQLGMGPDTCLDALRAKYDGYCFHPDGPGTMGDSDFGCRKVYNPFSVLNALASRRLGSWWFESGTPTFLVRRLHYAGLLPKRLTDGTIYAEEDRLSDYRADDPDPIPLMYQAGYLTIRDHEAESCEYMLAVPNGEVEWGLFKSLLPEWTPGYSAARGTDVFTLRRLVETGDTDGMHNVFEALFASIPYMRADDPFENYFQAIIWLVFALLGRYVACEVHQARGRIDCVIEARAHVYVIEFKRDGTAAEALAQIDAKGYSLPFSADPRELHLVGCTFDSGTRLLSDWQVR